MAGENKTVTTHVESGCIFSVDVSNCYFSPRLSHEHMRVARQVSDGETSCKHVCRRGLFFSINREVLECFPSVFD